MNSRISDLQTAVDYVRNTFAERRILLDYSTESVRHLDKLFDREFKKGKLKNPEGSFAKFQGVILIGVTGYLAEVIIKNTRQTQTDINEQDENWFVNFKVTAGGNRFIQPGQQILKRIQYGSEADLHAYTLSCLSYFNDTVTTMTGNSPDNAVIKKRKPWWKLW
jgi:hypothetical protein